MMTDNTEEVATQQDQDESPMIIKPKQVDVTAQDAQDGLMKVIAFLEVRPTFPTDYLEVLWNILKYIYDDNDVEVFEELDVYEPEMPPENDTSEMSFMEEKEDDKEENNDGEIDEDSYTEEEPNLVEVDQEPEVQPVAPIGTITIKQESTEKRKRGRPPKVKKDRPIESQQQAKTTKIKKKDIKNKKRVQAIIDIGDSDDSVLDEIVSSRVHSKKFIKNSSRTKCDTCGKNFLTAKQCRKHVKMVHKTERPFKCSKCVKSFKTRYHCRRHETLHNDERNHQCLTCGKRFKQEETLERHQSTHNDVKPFLCKICNKSFKGKIHYKQHLMCHNGIKPFICEVCSKRFAFASALRNHMRIHSDNPQPFCCEWCGKKYSQSAQLQCHIRRQHTHETPFKCSTCGKGFTRASNCKLHELTHRDDRPFSCSVCDKAFKNPGTLLQHKRTHTGARPFSCRFCGQKFAHSGQCNKHMELHVKKPWKYEAIHRDMLRRKAAEAAKKKGHAKVIEKGNWLVTQHINIIKQRYNFQNAVQDSEENVNDIQDVVDNIPETGETQVLAEWEFIKVDVPDSQ